MASLSTSNSRSTWSYQNQIILAPMVRVGTLPFRLLSLKYGATIVYSEELIDLKIMQCKRMKNGIDLLTLSRNVIILEDKNTIDFVSSAGVVFQTIPNEPVVFQIGSGDAINALKGAEIVSNDVNAVDLNMGCPVHFSTSGGRGSALMNKPEVYSDIIKTLVRNLNIPITAKIRILRDESDQIDLMKRLEQCGVSAIGVHARNIPDRPRWIAMPDLVPNLVSCVSIPVLYNGDIFKYEDIEKMKKRTKASSVMIGRGALWNPSVFSPNRVNVFDAAIEYVNLCIFYNHKFGFTKYVIQEMLKEGFSKCKPFPNIAYSKTHEDLLVTLNDFKNDDHSQNLAKNDHFLKLVERPWVLDSSVPMIPEFNKGAPVSQSNNKNFY